MPDSRYAAKQSHHLQTVLCGAPGSVEMSLLNWSSTISRMIFNCVTHHTGVDFSALPHQKGPFVMRSFDRQSPSHHFSLFCKNENFKRPHILLRCAKHSDRRQVINNGHMRRSSSIAEWHGTPARGNCQIADSNIPLPAGFGHKPSLLKFRVPVNFRLWEKFLYETRGFATLIRCQQPADSPNHRQNYQY